MTLTRDNITLNPADPEAFKQQLLVSRHAQVTAYNAHGDVVWSKPWHAKYLKATSNLIGNIMTRNDIRYAPDAPSIVRLHAELT